MSLALLGLLSLPAADETAWWAVQPLPRTSTALWPRRATTLSAEAWLRRVTFDLTGLPPTLTEREAFLTDLRPDARERVVDRLLASPAYGERMARRWIDLVHFAETHGHDQDRIREHAWPYRDYLVRSFNADTPFARFAAEQIAGDVLFPDEPMLPALGFLAAGPWDESSLRDIREDTLDRQLARYLDRDDMLTTVMQTFTSTTVHCARCHDHKFDPIPQADYYALQAVFAGAERGNRLYHPTGRSSRLAWETHSKEWRVLLPQIITSAEGATLRRLDDGSILSEGKRPERDTVVFVAPLGGKQITGLRLEVFADARLPQRGPGRQDNGNFHLSEFEVKIDGRRVPLHHPTADHNQDGWTIQHAIDGNERTAWGIFPAVGRDHVAVFPLATPARGESLSIILRQLHGGGHLIGRFRVSTIDRDPVPPATHQAGTQRVYAAGGQPEADGSHRPTGKPREVRLLKRGQITSPGKLAVPGAYQAVAVPFELDRPEDEGARRVALARWITHRDNPLFWRSIANRVWGWYVGKGLVETPNDFGQMGAKPSDPALLDHLALEMRSYGSIKQLTRAIILSPAYASTGRRRLDAEEARDAVLQIAGRLDRRMGGPSDREFVLKPGVHVTPVVDYASFDPKHVTRRGVYRFLFRTLPDPWMAALDCPAGDQFAPLRANAVTVQQALALWNSQIVRGAAREWAAVLERLPEAERASVAVRSVWGREPTASERAKLNAHAARHGWSEVARILFNSSEFLFVE